MNKEQLEDIICLIIALTLIAVYVGSILTLIWYVCNTIVLIYYGEPITTWNIFWLVILIILLLPARSKKMIY